MNNLRELKQCYDFVELLTAVDYVSSNSDKNLFVIHAVYYYYYK